MYLRSVHLPPVGLGDSGDLFLLAIRRRDQSVFGDLEAILTLDARESRAGRLPGAAASTF
jgi:hypothetical protein